MRPRVTVFIPVYNRARYIGQAIESVLAQSFCDFEILIIDDGSRDASRDVVARYRDSRIRLEVNPRNLGIPATRNRGLELARGDYLALLDSDDLAHPRRLERQVAFLDAHPQCAEVGTWCGFIDERGMRLSNIKRHATAPAEVWAEMLFRCPISNRSVMGHTDMLRRYPYDPTFPICEDVDVHCRIAREQSIANLPEVLVWGREHPGRTSRKRDAERAALQGRIKRALLEELGVAPSADEVARHVAIGRHGTGVEIDRAFIGWAHGWLSNLLDAGLRSGRYDSGALRRVLGAMWVATCWHGREQLGARLPALLLRPRWAGAALAWALRAGDRAVRRMEPA